MVRWSLTVSSETDQRLRAFLGQKGAKKGSLSQYPSSAPLKIGEPTVTP